MPRRLIDRFASPDPTVAELPVLTTREREVLVLAYESGLVRPRLR